MESFALRWRSLISRSAASRAAARTSDFSARFFWITSSEIPTMERWFVLTLRFFLRESSVVWSCAVRAPRGGGQWPEDDASRGDRRRGGRGREPERRFERRRETRLSKKKKNQHTSFQACLATRDARARGVVSLDFPSSRVGSGDAFSWSPVEGIPTLARFQEGSRSPIGVSRCRSWTRRVARVRRARYRSSFAKNPKTHRALVFFQPDAPSVDARRGATRRETVSTRRVHARAAVARDVYAPSCGPCGTESSTRASRGEGGG